MGDPDSSKTNSKVKNGQEIPEKNGMPLSSVNSVSDAA